MVLARAKGGRILTRSKKRWAIVYVCEQFDGLHWRRKDCAYRNSKMRAYYLVPVERMKKKKKKGGVKA